MQESYAKSLDEKITVGIQEKSRLFADRARVCLHLRAEKIQSTVDRVEDGMSRVEGGLGRVEEASNKNTDLFDSINNLLVGIVKDAECKTLHASRREDGMLTRLQGDVCRATRSSRETVPR